MRQGFRASSPAIFQAGIDRPACSIIAAPARVVETMGHIFPVKQIAGVYPQRHALELLLDGAKIKFSAQINQCLAGNA
ncbi:hypothetical protein D3C80_1756340 [compost metagenome]